MFINLSIIFCTFGVSAAMQGRDAKDVNRWLMVFIGFSIGSFREKSRANAKNSRISHGDTEGKNRFFSAYSAVFRITRGPTRGLSPELL
jgi:hypothetical protein